MDIFPIVINQLTAKYEEIRTTLLKAITQLSNEQLNWRPNRESNSISNLVLHIAGNINQRIGTGLLGLSDRRNRDEEFDVNLFMTKDQLIVLVDESFDRLVKTTRELAMEDLLRTQQVRGHSRFTYEVLQQCAAHYSEHLGQILYIAKICLGSEYKTTSIYGNNMKM